MITSQSQYKFHGGLHLPENKTPASDSELRLCELPSELVVPMNMQAGADAEPVVTIGEHVTVGQCIAEAEGAMSSSIHSPVTGTVTAIEPRPMSSRSGLAELAIVIKKTDSSAIYTETQSFESAMATAPEAIVEIIQSHGIVGLGGAVFPTATKINASHDVTTLLINAVECEPYICCDDATMRAHAYEVLAGSLLLARAAGCAKIQIGTEDNKPEAIAALQNAIANLTEDYQTRFELIVCPTVYPTGGERQLIEVITGKQVPSGTYPAELGYLVQNVGTALAVYEAMTQSQPLISRMVTVTGQGVSNPGVYRVAIGTPIKHLLDIAGADSNAVSKVIHGGPMMGYPIIDTSAPITKRTNCIIAATETEVPPLPDEQPCIRCGDCAIVCPVSLLPQQLFWFSRSEEYEKAEAFKIHDCIECGLCAYVCPSNIPLVDYYRFTKAEIKAQNLAREKSDRSKEKFDARNDRLERERLEKERIKAQKAKERAAKNDAASKNDAVAAALARVKAKKAKDEAEQAAEDSQS